MAQLEADPEVLDQDQDRRTIELAYFCLSRLRKAVRHLNGLRVDDGTISESTFFESSSEMEDLVIALQHVYRSCELLNGLWPDWATADLRASAKRFTSTWRRAQGPNLRHAYSHYEEAVAKREHPRRNDDVDESIIWHKIEYRSTDDANRFEPTPHAVTLLGIEYEVSPVYDAAIDLEEKLRSVISPIASPVAMPRDDRERRLPLRSFAPPEARNFGIVQDHSHLGGGIDWDRKKAIDAAREEAELQGADESE